jgi:hypothetical protein
MINFVETFKQIARSKQITSVDIVQYAILRAMRAKTPKTREEQVQIASNFITRHFRSVKNKRMLDNGVDPQRAIRSATEIAKRSINIFGVPKKEFFGFDGSPEKAYNEELRYSNIAVALYEQFKIPADLYTRYYVYIFVRQDLSPEYQLVQAAHAAARMGQRTGSNGIDQGKFDELYFSVIGVPDLPAMAKALEDFKQRGIKTYPFIEPDIGNVMTAFASDPVWSADRKGLLAYKRLVFGQKS